MAYYLDNPEPAELKNMIECSAGERILASIEKYWQSTDKYSSTLHSMMFFSIWESSSACFKCNRSINLGVSSHLLLLYRKTWPWKTECSTATLYYIVLHIIMRVSAPHLSNAIKSFLNSTLAVCHLIELPSENCTGFCTGVFVLHLFSTCD